MLSKNIDVKCRHALQALIASKLIITFSTHQSFPFLLSSLCIVHSKFTSPLYLIVCMNMKVALNKKTSLRIFNRAPINFWEPPKVEEDSMTKTSCKDHCCHEVKYDPSDKDSESCKKYIKSFSYGTTEQWLKFMEDLIVVICGNGLNNNGLVCFNLTCSSLKGEALHVFNDKAVEPKKRQNILMFHVSMQSWNMYSLKTICFLNRQHICTTTCSFM